MTGPSGTPAAPDASRPPQPVTVAETVQPAPVHTFAGLLDDGLPTPHAGDPLPPLWHWVALPRWPAAGDVGPDGHPVHGVPPHPPGFPRRMFAGGTVRLVSPLTVGDTVHRTVRVLSQTRKSGRQGEFTLVTVETQLTGTDGRLAVLETQDIIYRRAAGPGATTTAAREPLPQPDLVSGLLDSTGDGTWRLRTDPRLLTRFSAATANGHRIHYDWPYATGVEGYPGLVVHGPLMTLALLETVRLGEPERRVVVVEHRNHRPLFCGQTAEISSVAESDTTSTLTMSSLGVDGRPVVHTTVRVQYAP
ncbi:FAS1-like dehydratase domain-containing protein [Luedemannella helvata]|uniref:MaoC family dehydratase N-terminal domain-containing protein n=1 Tax=Luedemannella helvata TaxID=349315 RepID=A0ABP4X4V4_9ACTN